MNSVKCFNLSTKGTATDMRYFTRSEASSLVHKKKFSLIWQASWDTYFFKRGTIPPLSLNELGEKSQATIILGKFVSKQSQTLIGLYFSESFFHCSKFKARSHDVFFSWTFDLLLINSRYLVISHHTKKTFMGNQSWNTNPELVFDIDVQKTCF